MAVRRFWPRAAGCCSNSTAAIALASSHLSFQAAGINNNKPTDKEKTLSTDQIRARKIVWRLRQDHSKKVLLRFVRTMTLTRQNRMRSRSAPCRKDYLETFSAREEDLQRAVTELDGRKGLQAAEGTAEGRVVPTPASQEEEESSWFNGFFDRLLQDFGEQLASFLRVWLRSLCCCCRGK
ncbi:unnamed protein product [Symbiodinium pilosum]|uniref:Uncharacterized protein n=1 Tax=Symbiodinium pilosum TaxID=2952 RepID=A0A812K2M6_SYMPI|nr:unnamed protein product [Symbiodinium pilosum]